MVVPKSLVIVWALEGELPHTCRRYGFCVGREDENDEPGTSARFNTADNHGSLIVANHEDPAALRQVP